jgi:hypothetical protein
VRDVWVAGRRHIRDGAHALDRVACAHFVNARTELLGRI